MSIIDKEFLNVYLESIDDVPEDEIVFPNFMDDYYKLQADNAHNFKIFKKIKDDFKLLTNERSGKYIYRTVTANRDFKPEEAQLFAVGCSR